MKIIVRVVVAATAVLSIAGMAAPATAGSQDRVQQRNVWCC